MSKYRPVLEVIIRIHFELITKKKKKNDTYKCINNKKKTFTRHSKKWRLK